ncbi:hypothetical protein ERO13_D11G324300v2 [Gossypium hirsutum]|uniref:UPF0481 protein At3g47200 n=1 Tax=Gossypium hirsutum TaxID=3635 RepID=A0A1U8LBH4_GOSHI|nr:UPF0481 protein At3g47200-like [Gossypium hirsutum]KAG4123401.1 hypothetical protein ERO13_D11G324300v2 [Gossypium hirsutum]
MSSTEEGGGAVGAVSTDQTIIDINVSLSNGELEKLRSLDEAFDGDEISRPGAKPLIQRVPSTLRLNEDFKKYFKPKVISIGPFYHNDATLLKSEKLKLKLAADFVKNINVDKYTMYKNMKKEIDDLKKCYDPQELEKYSDNDEKLAWMFFVDGCAILQAVYRRYGDDDDKAGKSFIKDDLLTFVYSDLFLLENQIPFRVLELLTSSGDGKKFMNAIQRFIDDTVIKPGEDSEWWWKQLKGERIHLLHLLRERLLVEEEKPWWWRFIERRFINEARAKRYHSCSIGTVEELKKAGIMLKASETSCLTDISFNHFFFFGKLRLPPINVDDSTMNLIAYEMCPDFDNDFTVTSYMCFLDLLIDEAEDVKDLRDAGILYNRLGSDEVVAKLFNKMNTDLVPSPLIYSGVKEKIHNHCKTMWINHLAQGYHTYFRSPWTFLAFLGAIAALTLSALQAYYTIQQPK